jgi:hypothetical protein
LIPAIAAAQENCKAPTEAAKLPAVSALLDSARLIANLPTPDLAASKEVIVSVRTGPTPSAIVMDSVAAKTEAGKTLVQRVVAALKPNATNMLPSFRLRVLLGEAPALAVLTPLVCPPKGQSTQR